MKIHAWRMGRAAGVGISGFVVAGLIGGVMAAEVSPPEVLASVRIGAWGGCSGVTIAVDDKAAFALSAAHCCGQVGDKVGLCFVDGRICNGIFIAEDETVDLSLIRFPIEYALAVTPLHEKPRQAGEWTGIGFPASSGPNVKRLQYTMTGTNDRGMPRWVFGVKSGTFWNGDSGGGIVQEHRLAAITTDGFNGGADVGWAYACPHPSIKKFLDDNLPGPAKDKTRRISEQGTYCDVRPNPQKDTNGWNPSANVPIVLPDKLPRDGTFPDSDASKYIVELTKRVEQLEADVKFLKEQLAKPTPLPDAPAPALPPPPTDQQISAAVAKWLADNEHRLRGRDGKPGEAGVISVNLNVRSPDGTASTKSLPNLRSGTTVDVPITKLIQQPK
jgi:hypothetical protein